MSVRKRLFEIIRSLLLLMSHHYSPLSRALLAWLQAKFCDPVRQVGRAPLLSNDQGRKLALGRLDLAQWEVDLTYISLVRACNL